MQKAYDRELWKRVDEVLYYIWDPIGVKEEPSARDEYTTYVPMVFKLVEENEEIGPISEYFAKIIKDRIGLTADNEICNRTAEILLDYKEFLKKPFK